MGNMCTNCGTSILKSSLADPYLCRGCDQSPGEEMYSYLDMK